MALSALTTDDKLVIKHLYTERKMIPLNLYLDKADEQTRLALEEAATPSSSWRRPTSSRGHVQNFGVTRHGRVVFYDYDEICYMTECNFRQIPPPRYPEDEWSRTLVLGGPNDIFPKSSPPSCCKIPGARHHDAAAQGAVRCQLLEDAAEQHQGGVFEDVYPIGARSASEFQRGLAHPEAQLPAKECK